MMISFCDTAIPLIKKCNGSFDDETDFIGGFPQSSAQTYPERYSVSTKKVVGRNINQEVQHFPTGESNPGLAGTISVKMKAADVSHYTSREFGSFWNRLSRSCYYNL